MRRNMKRVVRVVGFCSLVFSQILTLGVLLHLQAVTIPGVPAEVGVSLFPGLVKILEGPPTMVTWPVYMAIVVGWMLGVVFLFQAWGALGLQAERASQRPRAE